MRQNTSSQRLLPLALLIGAVGGGAVAFLSCSTQEAAPQQIRAHVRIIQGMSHADPAARAERYCTYCHGANLAGGTALEPSCYTCHGQTWLDSPGDPGAAPPDHTESKSGYMHKPGLFQPTTSCVQCHGADLSGNTASGQTFPGCQLCHVDLWNTRTPAAGTGPGG